MKKHLQKGKHFFCSNIFIFFLSFERVSLAKQKNEIGSEDEEENEEDDVERGLFDHVLTCYD